jgi:hypothetical protein
MNHNLIYCAGGRSPDSAHFNHRRQEMDAMCEMLHYSNSHHQEGMETSQAEIESPQFGRGDIGVDRSPIEISQIARQSHRKVHGHVAVPTFESSEARKHMENHCRCSLARDNSACRESRNTAFCPTLCTGLLCSCENISVNNWLDLRRVLCGRPRDSSGFQRIARFHARLQKVLFCSNNRR